MVPAMNDRPEQSEGVLGVVFAIAKIVAATGPRESYMKVTTELSR